MTINKIQKTNIKLDPVSLAKRKIIAIDGSLRTLSTLNEQTCKTLDKPVLEIRDKLIEQKSKAHSELEKALQKSKKSEEGPIIKRDSGGAVSSSRASARRIPFLSNFFFDSACQPTEKSERISPSWGIFAPFITETVEGGPQYSEFVPDSIDSGAPLLDLSRLFMEFQVTDPNSDPWNNDYNQVTTLMGWVYELPIRLYPARYDISLDIRISCAVESWKNNFLVGPYWTSFIEAIILASSTDPTSFANELSEQGLTGLGGYTFGSGTYSELDLEGNPQILPKSIQDIFRGSLPTSFYNREMTMTRSIVADANQTLSVAVLFPMAFIVDRGTISLDQILIETNQENNDSLTVTIAPLS